MSRCLKVVPDETKNVFLVGTNSISTSEIIHVKYEEDGKKLTAEEIIKFDDEGKDIINDIVDIYPSSVDSFFSQVFNFSKNKYQLMFFSYKDEFQLKETEKHFALCDSDSIFE